MSTKKSIEEEAVKLAAKTLSLKFNSILNEKLPIKSPEFSSYEAVFKLPGEPFDLKNIKREFNYDLNGNLVLSPGDYVIPVMTYCMKHSGASPSGHVYSLSKLEGSRAKMIRALNLLAPTKFNANDIQIVSWSLQAGLSYEEMTKESQKIIDEIIPQYKDQLKESFLENLEKEWNKIADSSKGLIPNFEETTENFFNELGEVGQKIIELKRFKAKLKEVGNDYSRLSELINIAQKFTNNKTDETSWSRISNNVYVRFITNGHFQEIGNIQIRVARENQERVINSVLQNNVVLDLASLLANPNSNSIQPLSFSPLYGFQGVMAIPALVENPMAAALVLGAILGSKNIDWDSLFKLQRLLQKSKSSEVKKELEVGNRALQEAHDELEKPLKETGVINGKTNNSSTDKRNNTRQYDKPGGKSELEKDFEKLPGKKHIAKDGIEYKFLSNGDKIVKRPDSDKQAPTLEVQSLKNKGLKIKVRYL